MVCRIPEVADVHEPDEDTNNGDDLRKHVAEVVQLALERRLLAYLSRNRLVDITNGGTLPSEDNNRMSAAVDNAGTLEVIVQDFSLRVWPANTHREEHISHILLDGPGVCDDIY